VSTTKDVERRNASEAADVGERPGDVAGGSGGYVTRLRRSPLAMKVGVGLAATAGAAVLVALQHRSSSGSEAPSTAETHARQSSSVPGRPDDPSQDPLRGTSTRAVGTLKAQMWEYGRLSTTRRTLRVVSAPGDLTRKLELAWVTDGGTAVGDAHCTQTYRFNPTLPAGTRPTMMLCWRTSPQRSVYTLLVDQAQPPSAQASVAVLDRVWASGA
jgi:hypothetical protein